MKSRIAVVLLSISIAVLSLSLSACSGKTEVEESSPEQSENSPVEHFSYSSAPKTPKISQISLTPESSASTENTGTASAPTSVPTGAPTIFVGADDKPVYDNEVTKVIGSEKSAGGVSERL